MKAKNIILTIAMVLVWAGTTLAAETDSNDARPYIGVMLDAAPLPDLLVKHLNLEPGQGIRIANIHRGSPADKAGLERDDIIVSFEGSNVDDQQQFVRDVRKAGIGTEISLEIIHLGNRRIVKLTLEGLKGDSDLKYPPEPEIVQSWRPGKIFKLKPGDEDWMEVLRDNIPSDFDVNIKKFFNELYTYKHSDGEDYTITIEGSPNDDDTTIIVKTGEKTYKTTLKEIDELPEKYQKPAEHAVKDARKATKSSKLPEKYQKPAEQAVKDARKATKSSKLPEKYRKPAEQAVKDARKTAKSRKFYQNINPPSKPYFEKIRPDFKAPIAPFGPGDEMFESIKKQMKELQQRLDKLEKWHKDTFDSKESVEPKKKPQKDVLQSDKENEQIT